jgi:hypothetical protein
MLNKLQQRVHLLLFCILKSAQPWMPACLYCTLGLLYSCCIRTCRFKGSQNICCQRVAFQWQATQLYAGQHVLREVSKLASQNCRSNASKELQHMMAVVDV